MAKICENSEYLCKMAKSRKNLEKKLHQFSPILPTLVTAILIVFGSFIKTDCNESFIYYGNHD